ncbi:DUF2199 domain-containing protein [Xanthomonas sp. PPL133]|uniref:DUF2199 domain-containing protein n=2 Tax=unclassified Xanthomonas TaxID=2643310 RepID=UPI0033A0C294
MDCCCTPPPTWPNAIPSRSRALLAGHVLIGDDSGGQAVLVAPAHPVVYDVMWFPAVIASCPVRRRQEPERNAFQCIHPSPILDAAILWMVLGGGAGMTEHDFVCANCGQAHPGLPTDWAFGLPDEVFALPYLDRYRRARFNTDLCTLDDRRFFVRGVLKIPFTYRDDAFAWGVWAEVSKEDHDFYVDHFNDAQVQGRRFSGVLANAITGLSNAVGLPFSVELQDPRSRPEFAFPSCAEHALAVDQRTGIDEAQHHRMLELCGHFKDSQRMDVTQ